MCVHLRAYVCTYYFFQELGERRVVRVKRITALQDCLHSYTTAKEWRQERRVEPPWEGTEGGAPPVPFWEESYCRTFAVPSLQISSAVCFLLSPGAAYITGTCVKVDGGQSLYGNHITIEGVLRSPGV